MATHIHAFDGSTLTFTAEGPGRPHGVWTYDGELHPVSVEEPAPDAIKPVLHKFPSHDGLEITGWLFQPRGEGPHPTVLWLHGGPPQGRLRGSLPRTPSNFRHAGIGRYHVDRHRNGDAVRRLDPDAREN